MNASTRNTVPAVVLKDSSQFVADVPMQRGAMIPPVKVVDVAVPTKDLIAKGANLYKANCASCHGDNGMGDGLSAAAMTVKPRNLHSSDGWKNGRTIANIYKTLHDGILPTGMPAFNYTPAEDRFAMIHYIRTFAPDFPVDSLSDLMNLETVYTLSKGSQLPAQIPIKMALQKVSAEHENKVKQVEQFASDMAKSSNDPGANIVLNVGRDNKKIASTAMALLGKSVDAFVSAVSADPVTAGFKPEVVRLSSEEWNALHSYLSKIGKEKKIM
jgi:mono/diheme cytochrome c family protein